MCLTETGWRIDATILDLVFENKCATAVYTEPKTLIKELIIVHENRVQPVATKCPNAYKNG